MNAPQAARDKRPVFTHGSLMRHVAVMTATGAIGLMAVFVVDLLSLFWVSKLGDQAFKAAVGYVGLTTFFAMSINIGLTIAASATVSRALGAGDRPRARRLAASALDDHRRSSRPPWRRRCSSFATGRLATLLHARGEPAEVASKFIAISIPANVPLALGMAISGVLRAVGDARRAMYVTLSAGIATAFLDPLLIFGFGLGVYGAAWATVVSRLILLAVGWHGAVARARSRRPAETQRRARRLRPDHGDRVPRDHGQYGGAGQLGLYAAGVLRFRRGGDRRFRDHRPRDAGRVRGHLRPHRVDRSDHRPELRRETDGQGAAGADRFLHPLDRLRSRSPGRCWRWPRRRSIAAFEAKGESAQYVAFYCRYGVSAWLFLACLFVANTAFNNLGFPVLSMAFNWARRDAGHDSVRDLWRALWRGAGRPDRASRSAAPCSASSPSRTAYAATGRLAKAIWKAAIGAARGRVERDGPTAKPKTPSGAPLRCIVAAARLSSPVRRFAGRWDGRLHGSRRGG